MPVRRVPPISQGPNPPPGEIAAGGFLLIPVVSAVRPFPPVEGVTFRFETPQFPIPGSSPALGYAYEIINLQLPLTFKMFSTVVGEKKGKLKYSLALYVGAQEIVRQVSEEIEVILLGEAVKWTNSTVTLTPPITLQIPQGQQLLFSIGVEFVATAKINLNELKVMTSTTSLNPEVTEGERVQTPGVVNYRYI